MELVENVKESGGDVKIFSSLHVSGERTLRVCQFQQLERGYFSTFFYDNCMLHLELEQITGIAAILRFPMPELEDESDGDSDSDDDD